MGELSVKRGITLIATVVIIIVLIILASVTISIIANGGLFGYAKNSTEQYKIEQAREKLKFAMDDYQIRIYTEHDIQGLSNNEIYVDILIPILQDIPSSPAVLITLNFVDSEIISLTVIIDGYTFIVGLDPLTITDGEKATEEDLSPIDTTPPVIKLNGSSSITIALNDSYTEQGAVVIDNISRNLTVDISGTVNTAVEGTYFIIYTAVDDAGNEATVRRTVYVTSSLNLQRYAEEMSNIELLILGIEEGGLNRIGTALFSETMVTIRGINYYDRWYKLTSLDVLAFDSNLDVTHAPYIVRYEYTHGAVISITGEVINGTPIHTFNYNGDPETQTLYTNGMLTAVTQNSTKSDTAWGEAVVGSGSTQTPPAVSAGGAIYDKDGGLILGDKVGFLAIDQDRPVGERYSINVTVKGSIYQGDATYGGAIIAISDANSKYLAWIRVKDAYLQVISFSTDNKASLTGNVSGTGFMSKEIPAEYNNNFMNIQVTSQRSGVTTVYLNGELFSEFPSGTAELSYGNMTIGDLRPARGLKYVGSVYNFALYSEVLDQNAVMQNWNYFKNELDNYGTTGSVAQAKVNNVFDLAGNVLELTQECYADVARICRRKCGVQGWGSRCVGDVTVRRKRLAEVDLCFISSAAQTVQIRLAFKSCRSTILFKIICPQKFTKKQL